MFNQAPSPSTWRQRMKPSTWVVTCVLAIIALFFTLSGGVSGFLIGSGIITLITGLYVLATKRSSWAGLPRSRRAGGITMGIGLAALIIGGAVGGSQSERALPVAAPATTVTVTATQTVRPPAETVFVTVTATPAVVPEPVPAEAPAPEPAPAPESDSSQNEPVPFYAPAQPAPVEPAPVSSTYYKNCTEARNAGAAPVYAGDPGYATHLDRDGDGVGCEN